MYNLRPLPFGFLPVPFLGSPSFNGVSGSVALGADFRVLSVDLLLSMSNILSKSMKLISGKGKGVIILINDSFQEFLSKKRHFFFR